MDGFGFTLHGFQFKQCPNIAALWGLLAYEITHWLRAMLKSVQYCSESFRTIIDAYPLTTE